MPLALLFGAPNSGKSVLAERLYQLYTLKTAQSVHLVSPDALGFSPNEQVCRAIDLRRQLYYFAYYHVAYDSLTIVDYDSFIKSFRYELFCVARERGTRFCILATLRDGEPCAKWPEALYLDVLSRREDILAATEWDGPVFDAEASACDYLCGAGTAGQKRSARVSETQLCSPRAFTALTCQRIYTSQSIAGDCAGIQLADGVYVYPRRLLQSADFERMRHECASLAVTDRIETYRMAEIIREWLITYRLAE